MANNETMSNNETMINEPTENKPVSDLLYMAPDCFHLSQRGHASAGRALWNNMVIRIFSITA